MRCVSSGVGVHTLRMVHFFVLQRSVGESDAADGSHPGCSGLPGLGSRDPESGNSRMLCPALHATVLFLGCRIVEIPLNIFIGCITGRYSAPVRPQLAQHCLVLLFRGPTSS